MDQDPRALMRPFDPASDPRTWVHPDHEWKPGRGSNVLYRFYDADGSLLYVGITYGGGPVSRWKGHRDSAEWWPLAAYAAIDWPRCPSSDLASLERAVIRAEKPRFNKVHTRSRSHIAVNMRQGPQAVVEIFRYHLLDEDFAALVKAFKAEPDIPNSPFAPPANDPNR